MVGQIAFTGTSIVEGNTGVIAVLTTCIHVSHYFYCDQTSCETKRAPHIPACAFVAHDRKAHFSPISRLPFVATTRNLSCAELGLSKCVSTNQRWPQ